MNILNKLKSVLYKCKVDSNKVEDRISYLIKSIINTANELAPYQSVIHKSPRITCYKETYKVVSTYSNFVDYYNISLFIDNKSYQPGYLSRNPKITDNSVLSVKISNLDANFSATYSTTVSNEQPRVDMSRRYEDSYALHAQVLEEANSAFIEALAEVKVLSQPKRPLNVAVDELLDSQSTINSEEIENAKTINKSFSWAH